ncbi:MAG: homoserine kinase [Rhizomicrobium sp.]|jgi:homoserine kinase type II
MAVYTDVAFDDLEGLLGDYDIGVPRSFKGIAEGVENSNFVLRTDRGSFILTLYEKRVSAGDLPFFLGLLEHLAAHDVPCPVPVTNRRGQQWTIVNGRPAAILTWLDGLSLRMPDAAHCAAAGEALARLHEAGKDFPVSRPNSLSLPGWEALARATSCDADSVEHGLATLIDRSLQELKTAWPAALPNGVVHADLFPDNVLFIDDRVSGLIDFYFACNDYYAYDLAVMLNAWCFDDDGKYHVEKGRNLVGAYRAGRPLSADELSALPTLCAGAALRFLLTRLNDWLNPDPTALVRPKDPREFSRRLRFHRAMANTGDYGL